MTTSIQKYPRGPATGLPCGPEKFERFGARLRVLAGMANDVESPKRAEPPLPIVPLDVGLDSLPSPFPPNVTAKDVF